MRAHDWHNVPAPVHAVYCLNCDLCFDCEDQVYYRIGDDTPLKDDPGCLPQSERAPAPQEDAR